MSSNKKYVLKPPRLVNRSIVGRDHNLEVIKDSAFEEGSSIEERYLKLLSEISRNLSLTRFEEDYYVGAKANYKFLDETNKLIQARINQPNALLMDWIAVGDYMRYGALAIQNEQEDVAEDHA